MKRFQRDKRAALYVYVVIAICLVAGAFFAFLMLNIVGGVQEVVNPNLSESEWLTEDHFTAFYYATAFVTNLWTYIFAFIIFVIIYWAYIYSQRRSAGYNWEC